VLVDIEAGKVCFTQPIKIHTSRNQHNIHELKPGEPKHSIQQIMLYAQHITTSKVKSKEVEGEKK
jgi:hypothetical protein